MIHLIPLRHVNDVQERKVVNNFSLLFQSAEETRTIMKYPDKTCKKNISLTNWLFMNIFLKKKFFKKAMVEPKNKNFYYHHYLCRVYNFIRRIL